MRISGYKGAGAVCVMLAIGVAAAWGQMSEFDAAGQGQASAEENASQRKRPSVFRRPGMTSPSEQLTFAETLAEEGRVRKAARQFRNLVHAWHESPEALDAQMAFAGLLEKRGKLRKAFDEYQYLIDRFAGRFPYNQALDAQLRIANAIAAERHWDFLFLPGFEAPERAIPLYKQIVKNAPQGARVPEIQYRIAVLHDELGDDEDAIDAYGLVVSRYPQSTLAADAAFARSACLFRLAMRRARDEKPMRDAMTAFQVFLHDHPTHERATEARDRISELRTTLARLAYERAEFYDARSGQPAAARVAYARFLDEFPDAPQAAAARARLTKLTEKTEAHP